MFGSGIRTRRGETLGGSAITACNAANAVSRIRLQRPSRSAFPPYLCTMNSADCPPDTISPIGEKLGACAKPCIQEIFRPQNRGALAQAAPATSRAQDDLRLLRFHNGFCLQSDWSAIDARRAGERELTRLQARAGKIAPDCCADLGDLPCRRAESPLICVRVE